jgi:hypothetical protein
VGQRHKDESAAKLLARIRLERPSRLEQKRREKPPSVRRKGKEIMLMKTLDEITNAHLAQILKSNRRPLTARDLWKVSDLTIDDFYAQLKREMGKTLHENPDRMLEVRP